MTIQTGTTDSDTLFGQNDDDLLAGNSGDDTVIGGNHDDSLQGDSGDDTIIGGNHDDLLAGDSGDDLLQGGDHDDWLQGDSGDDTIIGGNHDDWLQGDSGNDFLNGEIGFDTLTGGDGADSFVFSYLDSLDVITDFDASQGDKILLDTATTKITEIGDLTVHLGYSQINPMESTKVTSIYFDEIRIIEFETVVSLEIEDFEFV